MLVKFLPEQVSKNWESFAPFLVESLPPITGFSMDGMSNVLRSILFGDLTVWVYYDMEDHEDGLAIYMISTITRIDRVTLDKNLLIYTFTSIREVKPRHWEEGLGTLRKHAKSEECNSITAYSANEQMVEFLKNVHNANTEFTLIEMEV